MKIYACYCICLKDNTLCLNMFIFVSMNSVNIFGSSFRFICSEVAFDKNINMHYGNIFSMYNIIQRKYIIFIVYSYQTTLQSNFYNC